MRSGLPQTEEGDVVLDVRDLRTYLFTEDSVIKAVDGVSFQLRRGESLGIVGESGCGKTMTALSLIRLTPQPISRTVSGEILLEGEDILGYTEGEMQRVRGGKIAWIPQDPQTSLNPVFTIGTQVAIKIRPDAGAIATTNPEYQFNGMLEEYDPVAGGVGDLAEVTVTFRISDGAVVVRDTTP